LEQFQNPIEKSIPLTNICMIAHFKNNNGGSTPITESPISIDMLYNVFKKFFLCFCLQITQCYFEGGFQETPVYILSDLKAGHVIRGPAIIMNDTRYN
jgi:hypothetical protein